MRRRPSEIGTGSGYQAAILSRLAREVFTIERFRTLAETARVRDCFVRLRQVRDQLRQDAPAALCWDELSMGMSGDYEIAIEEGATVVRVGQAIFGARPLADSHYWPACSPDPGS